MKTTNNVQKTEDRKFKNTTMKTLFVIVSFALFSFTAGAAGFWHSEVKHSTKTITSSESLVIETATEENLEIESWMINEDYFNFQMATFEVMEVEEPLTIEDWMLTNQNFSQQTNYSETDPAPEVENWMLEASNWVN